MERVNVYDFDKTILPYDSTEAFFRFCLRRYPRAAGGALSALPGLALMPLRLRTKTQVKESFYNFLTYLPDVDAEVEEFWDINYGNIGAWYLKRRRDSDIISSASPEFLLRPAADRLGVRLIASRVDKRTGRTLGENNDGEEKVRRLLREYPNVEVDEFFSDSRKDTPMALMARHAYLVKDGSFTPWQVKSLRA